MALELGANHELRELCLRGVAYHHGRLPTSVQRAIELALESGWLKVVFATSTLREGINTPASTVIVGGLDYRDGRLSTPISVMDFVNLAGRAGRPRSDTEGRIIVVPNSLAEASAIEAGRDYILSGESARKVRSQFGKVKDELERTNGEITGMANDEQRTLLSLRAADLSSLEEIGSYLDSTLWSLQEVDKERIRRAAVLATKAFASTEARIGERLDLASRVGLSLSSSESLRESILEHLTLFNRSDDGTYDQPQRLWVLLSASLLIQEVKEHISSSERGADVHFAPLVAWIDGESYSNVLDAGKTSGLFKNADKLKAAVKYCSDISNWLSWSFGAAWAIIQSEVDNPDPSTGILPLLIRYGVSSDAAALLSLLGVADRNAALVLARTFEATGTPATLQSVSDWMQQVDIDQVFPRETHEFRAELLRRQAFRFRPPALPYTFASFTSNHQMNNGDKVALLREGRRIFVKLRDDIIGEVEKEDVPDVLFVLDRAPYDPLVLVVDTPSVLRTGALVVIG